MERFYCRLQVFQPPRHVGICLRLVDVAAVGEVQPLVHSEEGETDLGIPLPATGPTAERPVVHRDDGERLPDLLISQLRGFSQLPKYWSFCISFHRRNHVGQCSFTVSLGRLPVQEENLIQRHRYQKCIFGRLDPNLGWGFVV